MVEEALQNSKVSIPPRADFNSFSNSNNLSVTSLFQSLQGLILTMLGVTYVLFAALVSIPPRADFNPLWFKIRGYLNESFNPSKG